MTKKLAFVLAFLFILIETNTQTYTVFLPLAYSVELRVGVEAKENYHDTARLINRARPLKISCVVADIVQSDGSYNWTSCDDKIGYLPVQLLVLKSTPTQWLVPRQPACKLPKSQYWDEYAEFVQEAIDRYQPGKIGIWNEPDSSDASYPKIYGCLGSGSGYQYGQFVKYIHDNTDGAQVALGEVSNIYGSFVSSMLNGADGHYDVLTFHCYSKFYYWRSLYNACGTQLAYAETLTNKPTMLDETAVYPASLNPLNPTHIANYEAAQTQYFIWLESQNIDAYWFMLCGNGWPDEVPGGTDLCDRPVYYEYTR